MIRWGGLLAVLLLVGGAIFSSTQGLQQKEMPVFSPKWEAFHVDPELLEIKEKEEAKPPISTQDVVITCLAPKPFPYVWAGYISSSNSSLVVIKNVVSQKEWILSEGEFIPDLNTYRVKNVGDAEVTLLCEKTKDQKELLYGKVLEEMPMWRVLFPDGQSFTMRKGDVISVNNTQWILSGSSSDPEAVFLQHLGCFHVSDSVPQRSDTNRL